MQLKTIALAAAFALTTSSLAFAQAGGGNAAGGTAVPQSGSTAGVNSGSGPANSTIDSHGRNEPGTSGMSRSGPGREPGARDKSRPGGEGVNDRPPG
jgi:hypothetical protein